MGIALKINNGNDFIKKPRKLLEREPKVKPNAQNIREEKNTDVIKWKGLKLVPTAAIDIIKARITASEESANVFDIR